MTLTQNSPHPLNIRKATSGKDALELFHQQQPDVLFIDLHLPDISGLEVIRRIRETTTSSRIVVLTGQSEPFLLKQVCALKVSGLLKKSDTSKNIPEVLNFMLANGPDKMFLDSSVKAILDDEESYVPTKREYEVLELMSQGYTSEKIALKMECTVATIKTYRARIMNKSGSRNSAEMISWFLQRNGKDNLSSNT